MLQRSHIEVKGWGARHYDLMMDLLLLGRYQAFIERSIADITATHGLDAVDLIADRIYVLSEENRLITKALPKRSSATKNSSSAATSPTNIATSARSMLTLIATPSAISTPRVRSGTQLVSKVCLRDF